MAFAFVDPPTADTALRPRDFIASRRGEASPRIWALTGGPGSGKTCTAKLLADSLGKPVLWLAWGHDGPRDLSRHAIAFIEDTYPTGATVVFDQAEQALEDASAREFLEAWLQRAGRPFATILASRQPLPFPSARLVAKREMVVWGPEHLWLSRREIQDWLAGAHVDPVRVAALAGWPLGIHSLMTAPADLDQGALIDALVREELLGPLDAELRRIARELTPLPRVSPELIAMATAKQDDQTIADVHAKLRTWGLLLPDERGHLGWHPLSRDILRREWETQVPLDGRAPWLAGLATRLAESAPDVAIPLWAGAGDFETAIGRIRLHRRSFQAMGRFRDLASWLAAFPRGIVEGSADLLLIEGVVRRSEGALGESEARLLQAARKWRTAGERAREFEALRNLLPVYLARRDLEATRRLAAELESAQGEADLPDRVAYLENLGTYQFLEGDEIGARTLWNKALDYPHLGDATIALAHQHAAFNLGVHDEHSDDLVAAMRHLEQTIGLAKDFPVNASVAVLARLSAISIALRLGNPRHAESLLRDFETDAGLTERQQECLPQILVARGNYLFHVGRYSEAAAYYQDAVALLDLWQREPSSFRVRATHGLAACLRRQGEHRAALRLHAEAAACIRTDSGTGAILLFNWALTMLAAGDIADARGKFEEALALCRTLSGPHTRTTVYLGLAVANHRLGDRRAAVEYLAEALRLVQEGPSYHALLAEQELRLDLWGLLIETGRETLIGKLESLFPDRTRAIREELAKGGRPVGTAPIVTPPALTIRCFGDMEVEVGSRPVDRWPRKKAKALLAHLLLAPSGLTRDELVELLYADGSQAQARQRLGNLTFCLRRLLEPTLARRSRSRLLTIQDGLYQLSRDGVSLDFLAFEAAYDRGMHAWQRGDVTGGTQALERAAELYRGDLLVGPATREWFVIERQGYRLKALDLLGRLSLSYLEGGHLERARSRAERQLAIEPAHEEAHQTLMTIYQLLGRRDLAIYQYEICVRALRARMDETPGPAMQRLRDRILQADV